MVTCDTTLRNEIQNNSLTLKTLSFTKRKDIFLAGQLMEN